MSLRTRIPAAFLALSLCFTLTPYLNARAEQAADTLSGLAGDMNARTGKVDELVGLDAAQLRAKVAAMRKELAAENQRLDRAVKELDSLRAKRQSLAEAYAKAASDMQAVEDTVRTNAAKAGALLSDSAAESLRVNRLAPLEALASSQAFPGLEAIEGLGDILLDEIRAGGDAEVREGAFLAPDGQSRDGRLLRAGSLFLGAVDREGNGFLLLPGSTPPTAVAATPASAGRAIAAWAEGTDGVLPLDPGHGAALTLLQSQRTLDDWMQGGGLLLWPILAVGLLAVLGIVYKAVRLAMARPCPKDFTARLRSAWESGGWPALDGLLASLPRSPAARMLLRVTPDAGPELRDKQIQEGFLLELRHLESLLGFIAVMAAVAPLLGLLGTVTGMIESFQAITVFGTSNPRIMSSGISEALITTQAGLGVAIPVMLCHQFLKQRVQALAGDMEQQGAALLSLLAGDGRADCAEADHD